MAHGLIVSTPYHGYCKNLALALSGRMDAHFTALWDHGHIEFWAINTLGELLREAGFIDLRFERVGRVPLLAKATIAMARPVGSAVRTDGVVLGWRWFLGRMVRTADPTGLMPL